MKEITMKEYNDNKAAFFKKHYGKDGFKEYSKLADDIIHKEYCFADGAAWYEVTMPTWEQTIIEMHGIKQTVKLKFYRTEVWNSDNSTSCNLYEAA